MDEKEEGKKDGGEIVGGFEELVEAVSGGRPGGMHDRYIAELQLATVTSMSLDKTIQRDPAHLTGPKLMIVSQPWGIRAATPVQYCIEVFHISIIVPSLMRATMNGKVCRRARMNMA